MAKPGIFQYITLDNESSTPKYQQLANCIISAVQNGNIKKDELMPSLNELSYELEIARDTAERGYKYLKEIGVLSSIAGKGFFIKDTTINHRLRVFLFFNKLSPHKKILYDSIATALQPHATIDLYIYDNNFSFFKSLLARKKDDYTHFVIIPHFVEGGDHAYEVINTIDKRKLILLDKLMDQVTGNFGAVFEDFESDIFEALKQALPRLTRYHTLKIIFPQNSYFPKEILKGFINFCDQYTFNKCVVHCIAEEPIGPGEVYINLMEDDLVTLIEKLLTTDLIVGRDVGVISYNETPLKKIILEGITTISSDFKFMGNKTAELILNNSTEKIKVPFSLTLRPSL